MKIISIKKVSIKEGEVKVETLSAITVKGTFVKGHTYKSLLSKEEFMATEEGLTHVEFDDDSTEEATIVREELVEQKEEALCEEVLDATAHYYDAIADMLWAKEVLSAFNAKHDPCYDEYKRKKKSEKLVKKYSLPAAVQVANFIVSSSESQYWNMWGIAA